tara:strand:+ start:1188 stop:1310 length:123 start_codon:yes stop_codon:yes gene_type:complete
MGAMSWRIIDTWIMSPVFVLALARVILEATTMMGVLSSLD